MANLIAELPTTSGVATPSTRVRTGLGSAVELSLTPVHASAWNRVPTPAAVRMAGTSAYDNSIRIDDVPSQDGRGGAAGANHDVTTGFTASTGNAFDNVAAVAKQGAPPRGEPR